MPVPERCPDLITVDNLNIAIGEVEIKNDVGNPIPIEAATLPLPTGASTEAQQIAEEALLTSIDTKLTDGSQKSEVHGIAKGATPAADATVTSIDANHNALDVRVNGPVTLATESIEIGTVDQGLPGTSAWKVDGSAVTQPVSATSLPLPTGASTAALQTAGNASLSSIDAGVPASLGSTTSANSMPVVIASDQGPLSVTGTVGISGEVEIKNDVGNPLPVSAATLPLPTGAATSALQTTGNASLASIDAGVPAALGQVTSASSMPVVLASDQSSIPVTVASLPLPAGAATSALQAAGNASLSSLDSKFNTLGQKTMAGSAPVVISSDQSPIPVSGTVTVSAITGEVEIKNDTGNPVPIIATSLPLPTGAATSALQTTGNASLAAIDAGIPAALGSTTSANSMPVVIASDQVVPISGTVGLTNDPTHISDSLGVAGDRGTLGLGFRNDLAGIVTTGNLHYSVFSTDASGRIGISDLGGSITVDAVALPLPTGAATAANQTTGNASLASIDAGVPAALGSTTGANSMPVVIASDQVLPLPTGAATSALQTTGNASLAAIDAGIPVALGSTTGANSMPVVIASDQVLPLPTGASTAANQATANASLAAIDAGIPVALGQTTMAASMPVVLASNQSAIPISGTIAATSVATAINTGGKTIAAAATQLTATSIATMQAVLVKAPSTNTAIIYVGSSTVTANTADSTDGIPVEPGESITIPVDNANKVYAFGAAAGQKAFWMAL